ncbi:unnamed protein product [Cylindrotheca closterium]|uniref:Cdc23 domain-containing protein n=1 Tax=Cylindrotheca closterium TaxID=2856 RepID=A0AAD2FQ30_9STRA|nr:unnamed protein product [Cylindrotheca closterium]
MSPVVATSVPHQDPPSYSMLFSPAASSLASADRSVIEMEVHWDPSLIRAELLQATSILSHRGLKLAAKWAAEQMVGIPMGNPGRLELLFQQQQPQNLVAQEWSQLTEQDWYAKSLMDMGEYLHASAALSEPTTEASQMMPPLESISSFGIYLRSYCLYLAGERRKEEEFLQLKSEAQNVKPGRNPYLPQLLEELSAFYRDEKLDIFGLYVYGLVLKEAQKSTLPCPHPPHVILLESILQFPQNWSAWLDLCEVVVAQDGNIEQEVEQTLQPTLATHYMYHFFCAHLMAHHHQAHEDALVLYERLAEPLPDQPLFQSSHLKAQLGVVHYHMREFEQALAWFEQIKDPFSLEQKDVYSNILYVKEDRVRLSQLAHQATVIDKYRPETCCIIGNYYSLRQQRQKAVLYFQRALKLDRSYTSAWTLMGHEYVELKQTESAMEAYRRAVTVSPKDYRAWYGLGQTYEFLNMHLYALFYYRKAAMLRPYDARMWCAVGLCFVALYKIPDAIRAYERAVAQEDTEGIATQKLATLYRQEGREEEAAQCYVRHLELRYMVTNPNPAEQPTLDDIVHGVVVEAPEAEALVFLAQYHKMHEEYDSAALFCSRLVEYPGPEKEQAKGLLRDLRAQGRRYDSRPPTTTSTNKNAFEFSP